MRLDPVTLEIVGNKLAAVTEEMCLTLQRTSRSLYVKETADFCCAVAGLDGGFVAYPRGIGVSGFVGLNVLTAVERAGPLEPGDVIITNDPYTSGGLATHLTDIQLIEPYFEDGRLVGYGWAFIHCSDIGGRVPSSLSPVNDEIYQEGLQIPPVKLVRAGEVNRDVEAFLTANSRTPEANLGDIRAMRAALGTGRDRLAGVIAQHGTDSVLDAYRDLVDHTAEKARAALARLDDGTYRFVDYLDDDAVSGIPVRLSITATLSRGDLHLDFTGTDPQVAAAFNIASLGRAHAWITTRVLALICTLDPGIALNAGLIKPITVTAPEGSLVNAVRPAAVGIRHAAASRVNDALGGVLGLAAPSILPAAGSGLVVPVVVAEQGPLGQNVQVLEPMVGGTGARDGADGVDGRDSGISNLSNNPVETVETEIGVEILRYGLRRDSGGAGRWRGGCGLELTFRARRSGSRLLARGLERMRFRPWGARGGRPGVPARLILNAGTPHERVLDKIDVLALEDGDVVTLLTSGAGGYGDPLLRAADAVLTDVRRGVVSPEAARRDYGVVIAEGPAVDEEATRRERASRPGPAEPGAEFGPERLAWESVFSVELVDRLVAALFRLPAADRSRLRAGVYAEVLADLPPGFIREPLEPSRAETARERLTGRIVELERLAR
ncbi:hydantoinase B/oxoprolinase family protein [Actinomadura sp. DC4]|uniref:hydantoinase B/oxoprolinase family protein n=1 Tax=Actinomadura sp. DC4 TaxID=3055069 RepID=UPI0025B2695C|nr:hydantoinase B/oxoprolinase family protein [Actinomadura sp. DC4]MDN3353606.1 hydantoinase B/oxoprolinase family protein [Actinomadura sp. DC4]